MRLKFPIAMVVLLAGAGSAPAAVTYVGTLTAPGDVIAAPLLFHDSFNSILDGGLQFTIAPSGAGNKVQLDLAAGTPNVTLLAATLGGLGGGPGAGPITLVSPDLGAGAHGFNLSALIGGGGDGGITFRL